MFEAVIRYTDELLLDIEPTKEYLNKLSRAARKINKSIKKAEETIKELSNPTKYVSRMSSKFREEALSAAKDSLYSQALIATRENIEFDEDVYFKALERAIESDDTYQIFMRGSGWNKKITVHINLDQTGGRINLWADAIKKYRKAIGTKVPRKNSKAYSLSAEKASRAWERIWDARGYLFERTIKGRLSLIGNRPAFWSILDKGTVLLKSDRGGYPTPYNVPTNFVSNAETNVNDYLEKYMRMQKEEADRLLNDVQYELGRMRQREEEILKLINEIRIERAEINKVKAKFGSLSKYVDDQKLYKAMELYKQGLLHGTIELTARGSRKRVRRSASTLAKLF